jgi:hypothetical protein
MVDQPERALVVWRGSSNRLEIWDLQKRSRRATIQKAQMADPRFSIAGHVIVTQPNGASLDLWDLDGHSLGNIGSVEANFAVVSVDDSACRAMVWTDGATLLLSRKLSFFGLPFIPTISCVWRNLLGEPTKALSYIGRDRRANMSTRQRLMGQSVYARSARW